MFEQDSTGNVRARQAPNSSFNRRGGGATRGILGSLKLMQVKRMDQ